MHLCKDLDVLQLLEENVAISINRKGFRNTLWQIGYIQNWGELGTSTEKN